MNRNKRMMLSLTAVGIGMVLLTIFLWLPQVGFAYSENLAVNAAELHVCASGCDYTSVQAAVDAANEGDVIKIAAGTYTGISSRSNVTQVVYLSKTLTIRGGYTVNNWSMANPESNLTTINAQGQGRVFYIVGPITPTLEGLHIVNGNAQGLGGDGWFGRDAGGGIYLTNTSAVITNCHILSNTASAFGGGMYVNRSTVTLYGNTITNNTTGNYGGGGGVAVWFSQVTITANDISSNRNSGVWIYSNDTVRFNQNIIAHNTAYNTSGGGVSLYYGGAIFNRNTIVANTADRNGGGIAADTYSSVLFEGDIIKNNVATKGGGVYIYWHSHDSPERSRSLTAAIRNGGREAGQAA